MLARPTNRGAWRVILVLALAVLASTPAVAQVLEPVPDAAPSDADQLSIPPVDPRAWKLQTIAIPEAPRHIRGAGALTSLDHVVIETTSGAIYGLIDCDAGLCADLITNPQPPDPLPQGALPGSELGLGKHTIASTWLAEPTQRLLGTTLGGDVAGALVVRDVTERTFRFDLGTDEAFEDRKPRVVDLGPDNPDTILVVRSSEDLGAALVALALTGEGLLQTLAQTEPMGAPRAWLNPIGVGDFTGNGTVEVALVRSPDDAGVLQILTLAGKTFEQRFAIRNVSNHLPGSGILDLAVIADFDGDHADDIAIPDASRQTIRILSFGKGQLAEPAVIALPAAVATELVGIAAAPGKRPHLLVGLADGQLVLLH